MDQGSMSRRLSEPIEEQDLGAHFDVSYEGSPGPEAPDGEGAARRATITGRGEIDILEADELARLLVEAVESGATELVLDLSEISFMGSSGLSALIAGHHQAARVGGRLIVRNPSPVVYRVITVTALDQVIPIEG